MKFKIIRSKFIEGLKGVQNIVAGKGSLPILQNVLIEADGEELKMTTTDLDISVKCVCPCTVEEKGDIKTVALNGMTKDNSSFSLVVVDYNKKGLPVRMILDEFIGIYSEYFFTY